MKEFSRRWFIGGAASFGAWAGCRVFADELGVFKGPGARLRVGIVSDIHILQAEGGTVKAGDTQAFEKALTYFRDRGADAVMIAGDMADKGLVDQLLLVGAAWDKVFPNGKAPDGRAVEKLFVYGNHDLEGQKYGNFARNLYPDAAEFARHLIVTDRAAAWERAFHEPYEDIYMKEVNGYALVGGQWRSWEGDSRLPTWFEAHGAKINPKLPMLFAQHPHPKDTCYGPWAWGHDAGHATRALSKFPNAIAFSGHSHHTLVDERSIWQGAFTSVGTGSLRYPGGLGSMFSAASLPHHREEAYEPSKTVRNGLFLSVYEDRAVIERRDFTNDAPIGPDWVMPLPAAESKPFAFLEHARRTKAPAFAEGGVVEAKLLHKEGAPSLGDVVRIAFPGALPDPERRALYYTVTAVGKGGEKLYSRGVYPRDFASAPGALEKSHACVLPVRALPSGQTVRFAVEAVESFGKRSAPLNSEFFAVPDFMTRLPPKEKFHVYLLIGQSNMAGRGKLSEKSRLSSERVLKLASDGLWEAAAEPLHFDKKGAGAGLGASFARKMADADPSVTIGLVPCAVGGSGIKTWQKGGENYEAAVRRAKAAMKDGVLKGVLWHQGESDADSKAAAEKWGARFERMVADLRAELGEVPFVAGELGEYLKDNKDKKGAPAFPQVDTINAALHSAESRLKDYAVVPGKDLGHNADVLHIDTPSLRRFGERYAAAMEKLQKSVK